MASTSSALSGDSRGAAAPDDTLELARRARDGDGAALGELLARNEPRLRRIARIRLGPRLRAEVDSMDVVQNAFVVAVRRFPDVELEGRASVLKWLAKIVEHQIHDAADRATTQKRAAPGERALASGLSHPGTAPDAAAMRAEFQAALDQAVAELSERDREIVLLRDYHDGDWEFVARGVGAESVGAVQRAYHRAWAKLRERLEPHLGENAD